MLIGKSIILDAIEPQDLEWMRYQRNDPELRQFFREYKDISPLQQQMWYEKDGSNSNSKHIYWKVSKKYNKQPGELWDQSELIGVCGLTNINWVSRRAELSIYIAKNKQGKGYAKEALNIMYDYAFSEINLFSIFAECYEHNPALNFYKNVLGMKEDGIMRFTYYFNGEYKNSHMLSVSQNEWREFKKTREKKMK